MLTESANSIAEADKFLALEASRAESSEEVTPYPQESAASHVIRFRL